MKFNFGPGRIRVGIWVSKSKIRIRISLIQIRNTETNITLGRDLNVTILHSEACHSRQD